MLKKLCATVACALTMGSVFAGPPPKPGESPRTSDTVPVSNRDLYDLLGKLADQQASLEVTGEQP